MAFNYLVPRIAVLPAGFDCSVAPPLDAVGALLRDGTGDVQMTIRVSHENRTIESQSHTLRFQGGNLVGNEPEPFVWLAARLGDEEHPGFLEIDFRISDGAALFLRKYQKPFYLVFVAPGKKSFIADGSVKYANPRIIRQIEQYGCFVDTYPVAYIDRGRDLGNSLFVINPYRKPVVCELVTNDERKLRKFRIPEGCARMVDLLPLLEEEEQNWRGSYEITSNNRVIVSDCKHRLSDRTYIHDFEHLEPFRAEPTHISSFQKFRLFVGRRLMSRGIRLGRA